MLNLPQETKHLKAGDSMERIFVPNGVLWPDYTEVRGLGKMQVDLS